ncbi:hypothetical protein HYDPIDRAFT_113442, partial [Hydnomerulius pinastri MD-312]
FSALAEQVTQPLIYPLPPASPCYSGPLANVSTECLTALENQSNGTWRANQPGSMQFPNYEGYTFPNGTISACYMDPSRTFPCEQGSVPVIGVDAHTPSDIQAAVQFAAAHNLRLVVKNTGHDYLGRSTARGSFLVWTHNMKVISYNQSFVPQGAPSTEQYDAITVEAGVQWKEAYNVAQAHGRMMMGGTAAGGSVGAAGGWFARGGYCLLSPHYGLGVDNAVQATIVISSGDHLTVNAYSHPDLWWALRGGGGGTYGVITSVTYRTHPIVPLIAAFFSANMSTRAVGKKVVTEFIRTLPALVDSGWSGHGYIAQSTTFAFWYLLPNTTSAQANASIDPFFSFARNLSSEGLVVQTAYTAPYGSFYEWYLEQYGTDGDDGGSTEVGSRLLPREALNDYDAAADAFLDGDVNWIHAGGAISEVDPEAMGLNPSWRKALVHAVVGTGWSAESTSTQIDGNITNMLQRLANISALAPDAGCYFNEATLYEANPQWTFFGSHYNKLKAIKKHYDPDDLFVVAEGVGSDEWDVQLKCRKGA